MPAEDAFRAARGLAAQREMPRDIILITVDDRTVNTLKDGRPNRRDDAKLLHSLFDAGAERVAFDKAYADPGRGDEDRIFAAALSAYRGRVALGAAGPIDNGFHRHEPLYPAPELKAAAGTASMVGWSHPFGLAMELKTDDNVLGAKIPSISAFLANYQGPPRSYLPDPRLDLHSTPTVNYLDVLQGRVDMKMFDGRSVLVGPTYLASGDFHGLPFGGKIGGAYFHVAGANTLREGLPIEVGFLPALLAVLLLLAAQTRSGSPDPRLTALGLISLAVVPFMLEGHVDLEVMPALMALVFGVHRLRAQSRRFYDNKTGLLRVEAFGLDVIAEDQDVFALKIRNYADIAATFQRSQLRLVLANVTRRLQTTEGVGGFAFEKDTIVWLRPRMGRHQIESHALGMAAFFRSGIPVGGLTLDLAIALGADVNNGLPLANRVQTALQCAEDAATSKKQVEIGDAARLAETDWRLQILSELTDAIAREAVEIKYQPKVDLRSGRIIGAEALLRWRHPVRGFIEPEHLVRMAEERGRIEELTLYVLDRALRDANTPLRRDPRFTISVNISAISLTNDMLIYHVARLLAQHKVPANNLILEVTETAPIDDTMTAGCLQKLKQLGVGISIDDFGTGQATLDYLRRIPSSEVKIDRKFVGDMLNSPESHAVVHATVEMAHALGRTVVAEGVETKEIVAALMEMGCNVGQGYLYSRAVSMETLIALQGENLNKAA